MNEIQLLDCTLRDGGYVNDWLFGECNINKVLESLYETKVEIVECGYLENVQECLPGRSKFSNLSEFSNQFIPPDINNTNHVVMLEVGKYDVNLLPDVVQTRFDGIRLAFHKKDMQQAFEYARVILNKGYQLLMFPMVTLEYSEDELLYLIEMCNTELKPYGLYVVDSFGAMRMQDVLRLAYIMDYRMNKDIWLGFHSHNNLQLAYSNMQNLIQFISDRKLIIDASVMGMGRGAGNLNIESFAEYLNLNYKKSYRLEYLLDIIDTTIGRMYKETYWGYSVPHYLSAINNCHPNYATFFSNKRTLNMKDINSMITNISKEKRTQYSEDYAEELYIEYNEMDIDDSKALSELKELFTGKQVLLLAPGNSIRLYQDTIIEKVNQDNVVTIWINYQSKDIKTDFVFINNKRRLNLLQDTSNENVILTSNLLNDFKGDFKYVLNYIEMLEEELDLNDSAGIMLIHLLKRLEIGEVYLAGFDGFDYNENNNYMDSKLQHGDSKQTIDARNKGMSEAIDKLGKKMKIYFVTPSIYQKKK